MEARKQPDNTRNALRLRSHAARSSRMETGVCLAPELRETERPLLPSAPQGSSAHVIACDGDSYRIGKGRRAQAALSCLVRPVAGDLVQVFETEGCYFITAVLQRRSFATRGTAQRQVDLCAGQADLLTLSVPNLRFVASENMALYAGDSCELASPDGRISMTARNLFTLASDTLIQQARTSLVQALNYSVKALELLHLKGRQQLISAETEVRIDGKHINMG